MKALILCLIALFACARADENYRIYDAFDLATSGSSAEIELQAAKLDVNGVPENKQKK